MVDSKISFRIASGEKSKLSEYAKKHGLTLTEYIIWLLDIDNQRNSFDETHTIAKKNDTNTSQIINDSETKFRIEFEKEISDAYLKGYQDSKNEIIKSKR